MRSALALSILMVPGLAFAQDRGMALNMGRGLDNGMSLGWTFKDNWTLRPTIGATWTQQTGFRASLGSTVLRSFGSGHRVYGYVGAGMYYGSANSGYNSSFGGGRVTTVGGAANSNVVNNSLNPSLNNVTYVTAPVGLRARVHGNVEAFAETAYQRTLTGEFGQNQSGQFSNNGRARFGATFGLSFRFQ